MDRFRQAVVDEIRKATGLADITLEVPPDPKLGDFAFPCFGLSKQERKSPVDIAKNLAGRIRRQGLILDVRNNGPYVNIFIDKSALAREVLTLIRSSGARYGSSDIGKGRRMVLDYSHPNIAKPFGIGHLRSTVIGGSLYRIFEFIGYKSVGVNHLGDWGTQFGKLIEAYMRWGDEEILKRDPINHLYSLYVRFHVEAEMDESMNDKARQWFKKLEDNDPFAKELWKRFRDVSLEEFMKYYQRLDIHFDSYAGEEFYNDMIDDVIALVQEKVATEVSDGALIVNLEAEGLPPLLLRKSDGASTYATRDIAAAVYRVREYTPEKIYYIVGAPQKLHFQQVFSVLEKMGYDRNLFEHVEFGLFKFPEGKMSTRKGNIIFLENVLDNAIKLAREIIDEKNPGLANKDDVAEIVGIGAIIFSDLGNERQRDIVFDWKKILNFEGETAPYIQYTHARICSILRRAGAVPGPDVDFSKLACECELEIVTLLSRFPDVVVDAATHCKPSIISRFMLDLSQAFNKFYNSCSIIKADDDDVREARLLLIDSVRQVLNTGLNLLGIKAPDEM